MKQPQVVLGVLGCPNLSTERSLAGGPLTSAQLQAPDMGVLFSATLGGGAHQQPLVPGGPVTPLAVAGKQAPEWMRFMESYESRHSNHDFAAAVAREVGASDESLRADSQVCVSVAVCWCLVSGYCAVGNVHCACGDIEITGIHNVNCTPRTLYGQRRQFSRFPPPQMDMQHRPNTVRWPGVMRRRLCGFPHRPTVRRSGTTVRGPSSCRKRVGSSPTQAVRGTFGCNIGVLGTRSEHSLDGYGY